MGLCIRKGWNWWVSVVGRVGIGGSPLGRVGIGGSPLGRVGIGGSLY